jgi:hypothetical protein
MTKPGDKSDLDVFEDLVREREKRGSRSSVPPPPQFRADPARISVPPPPPSAVRNPPPPPSAAVAAPPVPAPTPSRGAVPPPPAPTPRRSLPPPPPSPKSKAAQPAWDQSVPARTVHHAVERESYPSYTPPPSPDLPAVAPARRGRAQAMLAAAGLLVVVLGAYAALRPQQGGLIVTVSGPGGAAVDGVRVLVDGQLKCDASPCRVAALSRGEHVLKVESPGYVSSAVRPINIEAGGEAMVDVALDRRRAADASAPAAAGDRAELDVAELPRAEAESPAAVRPAPELPKPKATEPVGQGTLRINSLPPTQVIVDGRPMGTTPLVLQVAPGGHQIVFVHKIYGRKVTAVGVKAGESAVASVRFP